MKSLILAAFLFLSTNAIASNHVWWLFATNTTTGNYMAFKHDLYTTSENNKYSCLAQLKELYEVLKESSLDDTYALKCTQRASE